jgi:cob(I)alamin adenosyltransferase
VSVYTRAGDGGDTGLFGGGRVSKDHPRVAAYGSVDELSAAFGWAISVVGDASIRERLETLQHDLFAVGSLLAAVHREGAEPHPLLPPAPLHRIAEMEGWIDAADSELAPLREFVLPGGTPGAAALHVARTVCRRAERAVVALSASEPVEDGLVRYLNRLGDVLFVFARVENARAGVDDVAWRK